MARLFAPVVFRRDVTLRFRVTTEEKECIELLARDYGLSVSDWVRRQSLAKRTRSTLAATIINELVQLNAELKQQRENIGDTEEYRLILAGVAEAIERIPADAQMEDFADGGFLRIPTLGLSGI